MNKRLNCYLLLLDVAKAMPGLLSMIPKGEGYLSNQIKRAISSAILNLAEGNGRYHPNDRNRFFDISLGSISEVISGLDYALSVKFIEESESKSILADLNKAYYMIRKLKRS